MRRLDSTPQLEWGKNLILSPFILRAIPFKECTFSIYVRVGKFWGLVTFVLLGMGVYSFPPIGGFPPIFHDRCKSGEKVDQYVGGKPFIRTQNCQKLVKNSRVSPGISPPEYTLLDPLSKHGQSNTAGGSQAGLLSLDLTSCWIQPESDNNEHSLKVNNLPNAVQFIPPPHVNNEHSLKVNSLPNAVKHARLI